jgi:LPXTG-motif cell wall-anchored protein
LSLQKEVSDEANRHRHGDEPVSGVDGISSGPDAQLQTRRREAGVPNIVQKEMDVMIKKAIWIASALSMLGLVSASNARADEWNKKTVLTFSQPFEIPGMVLPAGIYTFELADTMADRHIVRIFNADRSEVIATVMTIPNTRLTPTSETVIKFREMPAGSPEAIRAWFYPGNTIGQEFVYPRQRATQLAKVSNANVPATAVEVADIDALRTAPIIAVSPQDNDVAVNTIQTTPVANDDNSSSSAVGTAGIRETGRSARREERELPKTASSMPLIVLLGLGSIGAAFGLMLLGKRATAAAR